ncbi:MAG: hypothetical protein SLAVMIC_00976 [uncultured marine phage]|uniref:Uncharacterized protein n=1 Tax=uncultured marine phage TaxID=707152 RepID=A0A8D9CDY2_9VIRU|nr:MAG: hypothetical protein SLAVMIC_00976 [uncultured marine phage]
MNFSEKWAISNEFDIKRFHEGIYFDGLYNPYYYKDFDNDLKVELRYVPADRWADRMMIFIGGIDQGYPKHVIATNPLEWRTVKAFIVDLILNREDTEFKNNMMKIWNSQNKYNNVDISKFKKYYREARFSLILNND